jgi:NitT/TauT family transport system permease protein
MMERAAGGTVILVGVVLIATWQLLTWLLELPEFLVPSPLKVVADLAGSPTYFLAQTWFTLQATLLGFVTSVVLAFVISLLIVQSRFIEKTLYTALVSLNSVPKVALAPLFVVWLGTGSAPKIAMVVLITIFVIVIEFVHGLKSVDPEIVDLGKVFKTNRLRMLWKIQIPNAMPSMFVGMKIGISLALIGAIVGEFVATRQGLGYVIMMAQGSFDTARMFAAILVLAVLGTVLFFAMTMLERICVPWHVSQRRREH